MIPQLPSKVTDIFREIWTFRSIQPWKGLQNLQRFMKAYNPRVGEVRVTDLVDDSVIRTSF